MPELPDAQRVPQPSPRTVAGVRKGKPPRPGPPGRPVTEALFSPNRGNQPTTVYVSGPVRSVVNGVAFALAEMLDLTPYWLDARDSKATPDGPDPVTTGWIPPDRLFISEGGKGLEQAPVGADKALWSIVRSDEPAEVLSHLNNFLHLPQLIQEIISAADPAGGPRALVVANSDRVAHLFPRTADGLQRVLATLAAASLSIVAAHTGPTTPGRFGFATVFRVEVGRAANWMEGTLVCEQGTGKGSFAVGRSNRLSDVPGIARVFRGLYATNP